MTAFDLKPPERDRGERLRAQTRVNGIDFVEVVNTEQTELHVHFLNLQPDLRGRLRRATLTGGETIPEIPIQAITEADWLLEAGEHPVLRLRLAGAGDYSTYTLALESDLLDPVFTRVAFRFPQRPEAWLAAAAEEAAPLLAPADWPSIDYLAKDFDSFRRALLDFSALRYPAWVERSEADFGLTFLEALCAIADDLSYMQDRIAAEAFLDTATQRRSLVRHARLVNYEPRPILAARVWLQCNVLQKGSLSPGMRVSAPTPDGDLVTFETGTGLHDRTPTPVDPVWNYGIRPYWWDEAQRILPIGATELWIEGHAYGFQPGQRVLLDTPSNIPGERACREFVRLSSMEEAVDPLFEDRPLTRIVWPQEDALRFPHDLSTTVLAGNLVPATHGVTRYEQFALDPPPDDTPPLPLAVMRIGANSTPDAPIFDILYTLRDAPLVWLDDDQTFQATSRPEIRVDQVDGATPIRWEWRRSLLDAGPFESVYTIEPVRYRRILRVNSDGTFLQIYDGDAGDSLRFGRGAFGQAPDADALFEVAYRVGGGKAGNVAAGTLTLLDTTHPDASWIRSVINPFAAEGGQEAETPEEIRRNAPCALTGRRERAVLTKDWETLLPERLSWLRQVRAAARWTGSWRTTFVSVETQTAQEMDAVQEAELRALLERCRMAAVETVVGARHEISLDLHLRVVTRPGSAHPKVQSAVLEALFAVRLPDGTPGFLRPERFGFGVSLERSALEAALQAVPDVAGVLRIAYRRAGYQAAWADLPSVVPVAHDAVLRIANDLSRPEKGLAHVMVEGRR
ncbi:MAG: hypothetical protein JWL77_3541 [Chthonomonadaceae bacterium]|nr:hypothetical protein [Chthonomonadaceae bacterium]